MAEAQRDQNYVPTLIGVDSVTGLPRVVQVDSATGAFLVKVVS